MLSHTARIHKSTHEAPNRPFAHRDAIDCSPPNKLALALARIIKPRVAAMTAANARGR